MNAPPTEQPRIAQQFDYTPYDEAAFARGLRPFLEYRELGLRRASAGLMKAQHVRCIAQPTGMQTGWHAHDLDFQYVFVLQGHVKFVTGDGQTVTLRAGDGAHLPPFYRHDEVEFAPDFQVLEITAPADVKTLTGAALDGATAPTARVARFAASHDGPDQYKVGDGPRAFLSYRDLGATAATARRVSLNLVKMHEARNASTGWHYHTLSCQWLYVLNGWSRVAVEGQGEFTIRPGDAMTIPHGMKHDVTGFSADFAVLELNIPADYDTIACDAPLRPAA